MPETQTSEPTWAPTGGWPRFAVESLLRLEDAIQQQRQAETPPPGGDPGQPSPLLSRAIFSIYLDCIDAGVGDDARRLLGEAPAGKSPADQTAGSDRVLVV